MNASIKQKLKDNEVVTLATKFLDEFQKLAAAQSGIPKGLGFSYGAAGFVNYTPQLIDALNQFVHRCAKALGPAAAHEKAIAQTAWKQAHAFVATNAKIADAVGALLDAVYEAGTKSVDYVVSNYLYRLSPGVTEIRIGRVRAIATQDFVAEREKTHPNDPVNVVAGGGYSYDVVDQQIIVSMYPMLWTAAVDAIVENSEEEARWLIDVAVSLLRLTYPSHQWVGFFPNNGDKETHPTRPTPAEDHSLKYLADASISSGGGVLASWYEIDEQVRDFTLGQSFITMAALITSPPDRSLALRVSQGLGWLTRGRQATDRAERLLYFFTAIEALLSSDDKTAPVTQTISRHGAVLLSSDNATRALIASEIRRLYAFRSALVHQGNRSVFWSSANTAQRLAESMYFVVLAKTDLKMKHVTFSDQLSAASYGLPWPPMAASEGA